LTDCTDRWLAAEGVTEWETGSLTYFACEQLSSLFASDSLLVDERKGKCKDLKCSWKADEVKNTDIQ